MPLHCYYAPRGAAGRMKIEHSRRLPSITANAAPIVKILTTRR
jgi:hypothetical protein